jgi:hypothetical protein
LPSRNLLGVEGQAGHVHWSRTTREQFVIDYKTGLPNGQVHALTTVSASGNELTGTATVKLLNKDGLVLATENVTVTGHKATSRLATQTRRSTSD